MHDENLPEKAIYFANHSGAAGPLTLSTYFPKYLVPWGTFQMTGNYIVRWKYLYYVFYQQKIGYKKLKSFILATLLGIISKVLYNGVKLIPTYPDTRLRKTITESVANLDVNNSILIFPEDSTEGYQEQIDAFHSGMVYLAQQYLKKRKEDIPLIPLYYNKAKQKIITGKARFLSEFDSSLSREEIADELRINLNSLTT